MKANGGNPEDEDESQKPIVGDVIGDTAYSQRFVLQVMLKLANLDTLKIEIEEKSFEDDLCSLWDMTAEKDVVIFLQKYDFIKLVNFALPVFSSNRVLEIIIGTIGNMCCHREVITEMIGNEEFLTILIENIKSDDPMILIQVLRLVHSSLFLAKDDEIIFWLNLFDKTDYSEYLYFILKNSGDKDLLVTALENFNTVCSYCNIESCRTKFFTHFVKEIAVQSIKEAFIEIVVKQKDICDKEELERMLILSLQVILHIIGFETSKEIYIDSTNELIEIINVTLNYYEIKIVDKKEIDNDIGDIIDSVNTILKIFDINKTCDLDKYFIQIYNIWKVFCKKGTEDNGNSFEEEDAKQLEKVFVETKPLLSTLMVNYMSNCSDSNFNKVLDKIGPDYEIIIETVKDKDVLSQVLNRLTQYREVQQFLK